MPSAVASAVRPARAGRASAGSRKSARRRPTRSTRRCPNAPQVASTMPSTSPMPQPVRQWFVARAASAFTPSGSSRLPRHGRGWPRGAPYAPRRIRRLRHPLEPRARAGHRLAGEGLLGVRRPGHGLGPARREGLDELDQIYHWTELIQSSPIAVERSVHAAIGGAYRSQGITTLELPLQPDEAKPRRRARPRPHHPRGGTGPRPREPRVPAGARGTHPDDGLGPSTGA